MNNCSTFYADQYDTKSLHRKANNQKRRGKTNNFFYK